MSFRPMKNSTSSAQADVEEVAIDRQRQRHRPAGQQNVILEVRDGRNCGRRRQRRNRSSPGTQTMSATASSLPESATKHQDRALRHRASRQPGSALPTPGLFECQRMERAFWYWRISKSAQRADTTIRAAHGHSSALPVFSAVMSAATAAHSEPANIGPGVGERPVDQRRVNRRRHLLIGILRSDCASCILGTRVPVRVRSSTPLR